MLHTNTIKKKYDAFIRIYTKRHISEGLNTIVPGDSTLSVFSIEASSYEEARLTANGIASRITKNRDNIERYEVTVKEKEE